MSWVGFVLFAAAFVFWCCLHLAAARWALKKLKSGGASEIDMNFIRVEDFEARETRAGRKSADMHFPGDGVHEGAVTGGVVADGSLILRDGARVIEFADSKGEMKIGKGCAVEGRATSASAIRLARGSSVRVCSAPEITTDAPDPGDESIPPVASPKTPIPGEKFQDRIRQLSADTWVCEGDLDTMAPIVLNARLVVRGAFVAGPGSELNHDVKATGDLTVGRDSICRGRLVAGGAITLGARCRFESVLYAGGEIHLGDRVVGEATHPVVAYAGGNVSLARGVVVRGKLAAGQRVVGLP